MRMTFCYVDRDPQSPGWDHNTLLLMYPRILTLLLTIAPYWFSYKLMS